MTAAQPPANRWLFGPVPDLLLGCGGAYALLVGVLLLAGPTLRESQPALLFPLIALLVGTPHYGATLVRVYEHRADRRRYALFTVWATALIAAFFVAGIYVPAIGAFLVTLYLSWSPWHYTGQNYGIAVMFARRNGVAISDADKRWLYWSFLLSFLLALVVMHGAGDAGVGSNYVSPIHFVPIGIPASVLGVVVPVLGTAAAVALVTAAVRLLRLAPARALLPVGLLMLTQLLWFSLPFVLRYYEIHPRRLEPFDFDFRTYYFLWIAAGHQIQYLWVTSWYARQTGQWSGYAPWYGKVLAAGGGVWMLPALIFGPIGLGALSMDQGLAILVAAAVNVHHFVLDGAIWKLRGRIAEILIRNATETAEAPRASWLGAGARRAVWAAGAFGIGLFAFHIVHQDLVRAAELRGDLAALRSTWQRLAWFGLDEAHGRLQLGRKLLAQGDLEGARAEFERSLALAPLPGAWDGLAETHARAGEWLLAAQACERGLERAPDDLSLLGHGAIAWRLAGQPERALPLIERALSLDPGNANLASEHRRVVAAVGSAGRARTAGMQPAAGALAGSGASEVRAADSR